MSIEEDLRATLRRRAGHVTVMPRPWTELVAEDRVVAELVPPRPSSRRWLAVAAAVLVVGAATIVLVSRDTERPAVPVQQLPTNRLPFDPATAAPVWPDPGNSSGSLGEVDPGMAADSYLIDHLGLSTILSPARVDEHAGLASVRWRTDGTSGVVYLRLLPVPRGVLPVWAVVGSTDDELAFGSVTYRGGRLSVSVGPAPGRTEVDSLSAVVTVQGRPVPLAGETLPQGGTPDPQSGVLLRTGRIDVAVPGGAVPVVRVRQVGGTFLSVAEFAVQPTDAPSGGRLIMETPVGSTRAVLYGIDRYGEQQETPCWVLTGLKAVAPSGCGANGGTPGDGNVMQELGPIAEESGFVLLFGAYDSEVDELRVTVPGYPAVKIVPAVDPVYPLGARYFLSVVPKASASATVEALVTGKVVSQDTVGLDPVGG